MTYVVSLISILWGVRIAANIVSYTSLWRTKEYRFDRMLVHVRSPQGRRIVFPFYRRPPVTPKTVGLIVCSMFIIGGIFWLLDAPIVVKLVVSDILSYPVTWIVVGGMQIPTSLYHAAVIAGAKKKLFAHGKMLVIGITGSFGKTSVKDYLAAILSAKFTVLKTAASQNSPIGIAQAVRDKLTDRHDVLVVEMGAYKRGEIKGMAKLVRPQIGVVTAINAQHQDLFGSLETTVCAKYELIEGLVGVRVGIFNADDPRVEKMAQKAALSGVTVWKWSRRTLEDPNVFTVKNIKSDFSGIRFTCQWGSVRRIVSAKVLGDHQASNIAAAIAAAVAAGMDFSDACEAASAIQPAPGVMNVLSGPKGSVFVDDTFNNNPDAAAAAVAFLSKASGRKILVFSPMIELGSFAALSHREVGKVAGSVCDEIILTNASYEKEFRSGVAQNSKKRARVNVMSAGKGSSYLATHIRPTDTVLFKGKEAGCVLAGLVGTQMTSP